MHFVEVMLTVISQKDSHEVCESQIVDDYRDGSSHTLVTVNEINKASG